MYQAPTCHVLRQAYLLRIQFPSPACRAAAHCRAAAAGGSAAPAAPLRAGGERRVFAGGVCGDVWGSGIEPKAMETRDIGDVLRDTQYGTSEKSNQERRGYPVLGMANITYSGNLALENLSYVELDDREYRALRLQPGQITFNRTNSTELVGKTAHWNLTIDAVLASYLVKLQLVDRITPDYFTALLNTPYYKLLFQGRCKKAVGQSNISPTLLKEFPMLSPPVNLQEEYGLIVAKHRRLQLQQEEALRQTEHLFQALLWRAFV